MATAPNAVDWGKLAAKLPWGKDAESTKARKAIFRDWDPDGNGQLSLAEIDRGLVMMKLEIPKPVMMRAYQAARSVNKEEKAATGANDDFVDWTEFRVLLQYIRQYMELWVMFDSIDTQKDRKLTPVEFEKAVPLLQKWGIKVPDAGAAFKEIDKDGGGSVLFDEFAHWAIHQHLKLGDGVEHVEGGEGSGLITATSAGGKVKGSQRKAGAAEEKKAETKKIDWKVIAKKIPWGKDDAAHQERQVMFRQFDPNNNGMLSLAEVDKGIIEVGLGDICCKAVIIRAFQAARQFTPGDARTSDDYLDFGHFRVFLLYVRRYLELWVMFDAIDADKDHRIQKAEFHKSFALLKDFGLELTDPEATFKEVDVRGTGTILFNEFADWAIKKKFSLPDAEKTEDPGMGSGLIKKGFKSKLGAALMAAEKSGKPLDRGEEKKPGEKKNVNWKEVADKLPWGTDEASAQKRKRLFRTFDPNGNGLLSLAEVDKGVVLDLGLGDICSKSCIMRAFKAASTINQGGTNANNDYVDFTEFRMLLLYLRQYIELWVMFDAIDTNKDRKIEQKEFANAAALVSKWGFKIDNMDATFREIDADGAGKILFDEFADWAIRKKLALEDGDGAPRAGTGSGLIAKAGTPAAGAGPKKTTPAPAPAAAAPKAIDWADVARKLPWGTDEESVKRRKKLFKVFDPNGNGLLSLAEVDKGVGEDLKMGDVICKAVIMRAYQAAKNVNKTEGANDDYIDFTEFRTLLLYLRQYLELWVMFDAIDTNKDKRIEAAEFGVAAQLVAKWGIPVADPAAVFKEIDTDGGGMILFDEFADWAITKKLELPDADDVEKGGAGSGVARTGADIKPKGPKTTPSKSPAPKATPGRAAPGKSPAPKAATATPKAPAAAPKPAPKTPTSPTAKAGTPAKATPPAAAKKEDTKEAPKVTVGIKFDANQDNGLVIEKVTADTPAAKADIQAGDKLVSIGGKPIQNKGDFGALVPTFVAGASFDVVVKRADKDVSLKLSF